MNVLFLSPFALIQGFNLQKCYFYGQPIKCLEALKVFTSLNKLKEVFGFKIGPVVEFCYFILR